MPPPGEHADQAETGTHLPHAAATFAEVGDAQAHKPVAAWFQLHPLQQIARAQLQRRALTGL
jgi:hypothetical protein